MKKVLFAFIFFTAVGASALWFWYEAPLKAKDPAQAGFELNKFRFIDYPSYKQREKVLNTILPAGTSKEDVDKLLVEIAGATSHGVNKYSKGFSRYSYRPWTLEVRELMLLANCPDYIVYVCYSNDTVKFLKAAGPCFGGLLGNLLNPDSNLVCSGHKPNRAEN